jgi:hypothetical protein
MDGLHVSILPFITILAGNRRIGFIIGKGGLRSAGCGGNVPVPLHPFARVDCITGKLTSQVIYFHAEQYF